MVDILRNFTKKFCIELVAASGRSLVLINCEINYVVCRRALSSVCIKCKMLLSGNTVKLAEPRSQDILQNAGQCLISYEDIYRHIDLHQLNIMMNARYLSQTTTDVGGMSAMRYFPPSNR